MDIHFTYKISNVFFLIIDDGSLVGLISFAQKCATKMI